MGVAAEWSYSFNETSRFNQLAAISVNDRSGNGRVAGVQVLHDVTPPTILVLDTPIKTYGEPAVVQWNAMDDGAGVRGYDLFVLVDGITRTQVLTQSTATSYDAGVLPNTHFYEWQLVAWDRVNNSNARTATTAGVKATKTYYFGASRVAVREAGVLSYLHSDQLSSVSASTDANGKVVGRQLFEPYGGVRAEFGEVDGSWGWATHRKTEDTGLTFMRARWYAPGVGRFISADSIVPDASDPQAFNRYSLTLGNPFKYADPTGHFSYLISLRSFAPFDVFGFAYKGDNRGYSTRLRDTSRIEQHLAVDTEKSKISSVVLNNASHDIFGNEGQRSGTGGVSQEEFSQGENLSEATFRADYHGANGLTGPPPI